MFYYQEVVHVHAAEIEIHGQIGEDKVTVQPPKESETKIYGTLAKPKQTHIELKTFPNTGSMTEKVTLLGLLLLLIYVLLSRWKAHRKKRPG
ncbi:hypothetical protein RV12_GL000933 [Enterococcus quebecensis]|nr:hypothetical protein RV12_GL000933 [Enterococcus quebecensis]